jgi:hypothetical protein
MGWDIQYRPRKRSKIGRNRQQLEQGQNSPCAQAACRVLPALNFPRFIGVRSRVGEY